MKFESRFVATVHVVHNLVLLAGLLNYLHTFTHALVHTRRLTPALINYHTIAHSLTVTHTHTYTYNHHIDTQTFTYLQHTHSLKNTNIQLIHTYTCIHERTLTIQCNHTHTYTHNKQILTQIYTYLSIQTYTHIIIHTHIHVRAYFLIFKNTQTYTSAH